MRSKTTTPCARLHENAGSQYGNPHYALHVELPDAQEFMDEFAHPKLQKKRWTGKKKRVPFLILSEWLPFDNQKRSNLFAEARV